MNGTSDRHAEALTAGEALGRLSDRMGGPRAPRGTR
jgi:hypothetical protein